MVSLSLLVCLCVCCMCDDRITCVLYGSRCFWHGVDRREVRVNSGVFIICLVVLNQILKYM